MQHYEMEDSAGLEHARMHAEPAQPFKEQASYNCLCAADKLTRLAWQMGMGSH